MGWVCVDDENQVCLKPGDSLVLKAVEFDAWVDVVNQGETSNSELSPVKATLSGSFPDSRHNPQFSFYGVKWSEYDDSRLLVYWNPEEWKVQGVYSPMPIP